MRIAALVHQFPKLSETFILSQLNGLIAMGHDVTICAQEAGDESVRQPAIERHDLMARTRYLPSRATTLSARAANLLNAAYTMAVSDPALATRALVPEGLMGPRAYQQRLAWASVLANQAPPDVIHCHFGTLQHAGMHLLSLCPSTTRLAVSFRGRDLSTAIKQHGTGIYETLFRTGHVFMPCCAALGRKLADIGCPPDRIRVTYDGVDVTRFHFRPRTWSPGEPLRLACVGRFADKKGFDDAIRAVASLRASVPNLTLTIVGEGPLQARYESLAAELGIADQLHLPGPIAHDKLPEFLDPYHVFVAPSRTAEDGDQEGLATTIKEAMAMGIPVVATDHSGTSELVRHEDTGILVPENDSERLTAGLRQLVDGYATWSELTARARNAVETAFSEAACNQMLLAALQEAPAAPTPVDALGTT